MLFVSVRLLVFSRREFKGSSFFLFEKHSIDTDAHKHTYALVGDTSLIVKALLNVICLL